MEHKDDPSQPPHPADIVTGNYAGWKNSAVEKEVIVIGGGVSGLTAAKTLIENNITNILLLEADSRIGGRVRTYRQGNLSVEEGAEWIHGGERNTLYRLAKELQAVVPCVPDDAWDERVVTNNGHKSDPSKFEVVEDLMEEADTNGILEPYYHTGYGQFYLDRFPKVYGKGWDSTLGQAWLHLLEKTVNAEEGTNNWLDMSARDADQYVAKGQDHHWRDGFDTVVKYLQESIPDEVIRLSSPVCQIFWDQDDGQGVGKVLLVTNNGRSSYSAGRVIVAISVGYLKERHQHLFRPPLPVSLVKDLNSIELGVADKIQIGWEEPWWGSKDPLSLVILWKDRNLPKDMEWLYGIVQIFSVNQHPNVLLAFVTGGEAKVMERLPKDLVKRHLMHLLATTTGIKVPEPILFTRSQWGQNPWTRGSYSSYVTVEGDGNGLHKRQRLGMPLNNSLGKTVVFWAGEHIHNTRYGTVDGAMEVGEQQARRLIRKMKEECGDHNNSKSARVVNGNK
ncbi:spermine oxidase-like [Macrobrachium rosenbergii]|uniref:spermine oxidase-like n=1 Tax=Macrobrachium rosenbergii TaxID=79674 RepID=UPI0034D4F316